MRRVLVVEDSPTQAAHLRSLLEAGGYAVALAASGREALQAARREPPAVVVSDIVMPEMDGYALCRRIKADEALRDTPVLLVTVLGGPHDIIRALECGADSVIRKPYDEQYLLSRVAYLCANRELRRHEKTRMGLEIDVAGERHFVSAERRQILDLLISTYEEAVRLNEELSARQREIERSAQTLHALYGVAEGLNRATSEGEVVAIALERALELPGVRAGWISFLEDDGTFRLLGARGLPPALAAPDAMQGDCRCRRMLVAGDLDRTTNVLECERLQRAIGDTAGLRHHASVPLWIGDRTLGVLNLAGPGPGLFADEDLKMLFGVGNQVAIALGRAQLLQDLEHEVLRRTADLAAEAAGRERAEETRRRLTAILEATTDFVAMGHADGRVEYYNRAARRMLGIVEREDISTIRIADTHPAWAARLVLEEAIPAAIRDGIWSGETALLGRDGREIPVLQVIIAHRTAEGRIEFLSTIARDITERKRAEEARRQSEKLAAMGELLAGVAHELNNPLAVLTGQAALLGPAVAGGPLQPRAEKIARAAERCSRIVRNFLALARQYPPEREEVRLDRIVHDAVELLAYQLRLDAVEVVINLAADLPLLWADPHQLQQLVVNLATNAHHAMRASPSPRRLVFTGRADADRSRIVFTVADTGAGIPPEIQGRIFEPFFTTKPPGQGTGLGLSLCRGIVESHGGTIKVESRPGQGATFVVDLPAPPPPPDAHQARGPAARPHVTGKTLLVVDDDPDVADVIAEMLAADGHRVDRAPNGAVALELLATRTYDAILSDIRMPELDGTALYREVERRHPDLARRFIFLTGDTLSAETSAFLEQHRAPSVTKPFSLEEVRPVIDRITGPG